VFGVLFYFFQGKAIPVTGLERPSGFQEVGLPDFMTICIPPPARKYS